MKQWEIYEALKEMLQNTNVQLSSVEASLKGDQRRLNALLKKNDPIYNEVITDLQRDIAHNLAVRDELEERAKNIMKKADKIAEEQKIGVKYEGLH